MKKVQQVFAKGINKRVAKDQSSPERLHVLKNARIFKRGDTLYVSRIEGYQHWADLTPIEPLDLDFKEGAFNTTDFKNLYKLRFTEEVTLNEETNLGSDRTEFVATGELFSVRVIPILKFVEGLSVTDTTPQAGELTTDELIGLPQFKALFNAKIQPKLEFVEGINLNDNTEIPSTFTLSFVEGVDIVDSPLCQ
jgi:hypothetical protein